MTWWMAFGLVVSGLFSILGGLALTYLIWGNRTPADKEEGGEVQVILVFTLSLGTFIWLCMGAH